MGNEGAEDAERDVPQQVVVGEQNAHRDGLAFWSRVTTASVHCISGTMPVAMTRQCGWGVSPLNAWSA